MSNWLVNRMSEPTSYAGIAAAANGVANILYGNFAPQNWVEAIFGAIAFAMPEATPVANSLGTIVADAIANAKAAKDAATAAQSTANSAQSNALNAVSIVKSASK